LSAVLAPGSDILVVGSQAILGVVPENKLPAETVVSVEADLTFLDGRRDLGIAEGVPLLVVETADGTEKVHSADRTVIVVNTA